MMLARVKCGYDLYEQEKGKFLVVTSGCDAEGASYESLQCQAHSPPPMFRF